MIIYINNEDVMVENQKLFEVTIYFTNEDGIVQLTDTIVLHTPDNNRIVLNPEKADFKKRVIDAKDVIISDKGIEIYY